MKEVKISYTELRLAGIDNIDNLKKEVDLINEEYSLETSWDGIQHNETGVRLTEISNRLEIVDCVSTKKIFSKDLVEAFSYLYLDDEEDTELCLYSLSLDIRKSFYKLYKIRLVEENIFTLSKEGEILQNGRRIKPGKFVRTLFPLLTEDQVSFVVDTIRYSVIKIDLKDTDDVNALYNNPNARITSCMRDKNVTVLNEAGFTAKYLEVNGKIIARVLMLGNAFSKVYATSATLQNKIEEHLKEKGFVDAYMDYDPDINKDIQEIRSNFIYGNFEERFVPYMDTLPFIHTTSEGFFFSNYKEGSFAECASETGVPGENDD